jgi:undecaprenyl diphosphate synthase
MSTLAEIDFKNIPKHIAIIMDGNGRWAQKRGMLRTLGHKIGVDSVRDIVKASRQLEVEVLTLYAFSTENWKRPSAEVKTLMTLLKTYLEREFNDLKKNNIVLRCIGQQEKLPSDVLTVLQRVIKDTSSNDGMVLNLALSYGSRNEIVCGVKDIVNKCIAGEIKFDTITEQTISDHLQTNGQIDPDLLIRTGGEARLSNFLLWQASYSELYFTDTYWPQFRKKQLFEAIREYQDRQRRFGKTGEQVKK